MNLLKNKIFMNFVKYITIILISFIFVRLYVNHSKKEYFKKHPLPPHYSLTDSELISQTKEEYEKNVQKWKDHCYFAETQKANYITSAERIRDILGKQDKTLYDIEGNEHTYKYKKGFFKDEWYLDNILLGNSCNEDSIGWKLYYLNDTRPPQPPRGVAKPTEIAPKPESQEWNRFTGKYFNTTTYNFDGYI
ncbi:hypothetical protein [Candidatus Phytoplasma pruni]|uniref:Uncharacterized protein n=1 Tax=Candidatus Phytoplasma pruni TaxID=479893 RepID=A0A851HHG1_9MOLU|nr:hypothetical protein [Candidatus Phytoplasma pruni]NWN45724.1 hypothetical protein [Candidatus Phytoplasma pruni]